MVGLLTAVIIRVGSVTSTCVRSSFGDIRLCSAPISPLSSGAPPGQIATTCGSSALRAGEATHTQATRKTADGNRITDRDWVCRSMRKGGAHKRGGGQAAKLRLQRTLRRQTSLRSSGNFL